METLLDVLRQFDAARTSVDRMVELLAYARMLESQYTVVKLKVPEWIEDAISRLMRTIEAKRKDELSRQLRALEQAATQDQTPDERRKARQEQMDAIRKELGEPVSA